MTAANSSDLSDREAPRRHRLRRGCFITIAIILIAAIVVPLGIYRRLKTVPAHWGRYQKFLQTTTLEQRRQIAQTVQARFLATLSARTAGDQPIGSGDGLGLRTFSLTTDEANCWLETLMPQWWANQQSDGSLPPLPAEITQPHIVIDSGQLVLSFQYASPQHTQVVSLYCAATVPEEGQLKFQVDKVVGGTMPVPQSFIRRFAGNGARGAQLDEQLQSAFDGKVFPAKSVMPGNRVGKIKGFRVRDDGLDIDIDIVSRGNAGA
jgi:hypothetical protein